MENRILGKGCHDSDMKWWRSKLRMWSLSWRGDRIFKWTSHAAGLDRDRERKDTMMVVRDLVWTTWVNAVQFRETKDDGALEDEDVDSCFGWVEFEAPARHPEAKGQLSKKKNYIWNFRTETWDGKYQLPSAWLGNHPLRESNEAMEMPLPTQATWLGLCPIVREPLSIYFPGFSHLEGLTAVHHVTVASCLLQLSPSSTTIWVIATML